MNSYSFAVLFFAFCSMPISILILLKRTDEVAKTFFIFSCLASGWGIAISWAIGNNPEYEIALQSNRVAHFCSLFIPPAWLHCIYAYLGKSNEKKNLIRAFYLWSFILLPFTFSDLYVRGVKQILVFSGYMEPGLVYHFFTVEFLVAVCLAFFELFRNLYINPGSRSKAQDQAFTYSTLVAFLGGTLTFFPVYNIPFPQYGLYIMPLYPFMMAYAMIRHGLLDSDEVLAIHRDKLALLGLMSSSINHEIRNPLFLIQELSRKLFTLDGLARNSEAVNVLDKMTIQIERMNKLTNRLSEFSRPSENGAEALSLKQVIEDALFFASQELKYQNIEVRLNMPDNLHKVKGNKGQFEEIFLNLIVNAYHAMPDGGVLTIEGRNMNGSVEITVADTGVGIPKDELKNIFKPFYTTKEKIGTGLGLHIVQTLVEQNDGLIAVESDLQKGATFKIVFKNKESYV